MATDFWSSTHYKRWIIDNIAIQAARTEDLRFADHEQLAFIDLFFANLISKLGKKLAYRQRVVATATVFFKRFYLKNAYCDTDPFIVATACCYVAGKAEELPVHIKTVIQEAKAVFADHGIYHFTADNHKLAEMEFYLVDELECDLVVFHPYRTLMTLCGKDDGTAASVIEAGELGVGGIELVPAGPGEVWEGNGIKRYWGSGEGKLLLDDKTLQLAWLIINDTYRTDVCMKYPPFVIAIAAIYLALVNHDCCSQSSPSVTTPLVNIRATRRTSHPGLSSVGGGHGPDPVTFLAKLNVSMSSIASIAQEMISLYSLWSRYSDDSGSGSSNPTSAVHHASKVARGRGDQTPGDSVDGELESSNGAPEKYRAKQMAELVVQMREKKEKEVLTMERMAMVSPATRAGGLMAAGGRVVNKRLERAQAAG